MLHSRLLKCKQYKWFTCCCLEVQNISNVFLTQFVIEFNYVFINKVLTGVQNKSTLLWKFWNCLWWMILIMSHYLELKICIFFTYISHSEFARLKMVVETSVEQIVTVFHSAGVKISIRIIIMYNKNMNSTSITYQCRCVHYCWVHNPLHMNTYIHHHCLCNWPHNHHCSSCTHLCLQQQCFTNTTVLYRPVRRSREWGDGGWWSGGSFDSPHTPPSPKQKLPNPMHSQDYPHVIKKGLKIWPSQIDPNPTKKSG